MDAQRGELLIDRKKYKIDRHPTFASRLNAVVEAVKVRDIIHLIFF